MLDQRMDRDKKNQWYVPKPEVGDNEEYGKKHIRDNDKEIMPLLRFAKKRDLSSIEGESALKQHIKHYRCSSPLSAVQDQNPNKQAAMSPLPFEQAQEHGDKVQIGESEWEIKKIIDRRQMMSGIEYKVQWKNTWLPKGELGNARKLLREFEAQRRSQHRHKRGRPARALLSSCP